MTNYRKEDLLDAYGDDLLFADGFDDALMGVAERCGMSAVALYDTNKCIQILMDRDGMTYDEAWEFFEFNVVGAYVGEMTPMFAHLFESE